ncbi:MAG: type II secretion system F family protein [Candidatus Levybacteria bacterium]|nr:type II secretion system F family protein [Candidatus Levybacteria bacterium]
MSSLTLSGNDKLGLISNLATMIAAGIPILETIDSLLEDAKGNTKKILEKVREDLTQGRYLYSSFANFPNVFDKVSVNIIKAAEEAGTLDVTLKDLKELIKKELEFADEIKGALSYPVLIIIVFVIILFLILVVVIPKISVVFLQLGVSLPLPTKVLIYLSNLLTKNTLPVMGIIILFLAGLFFIYKFKKEWFHSILYSLPIVSGLINYIDLIRFSRSMNLLLSSGITITTALEFAEDVVVKKDMVKAIHATRKSILVGKDLSDGFKENKKIFPSIMIKIIEAGEKTGTLETSMQDISDYLNYQITNKLKTLTTLLEPIMLIVIGVMVGGMMLSIFGPMYGLITNIGGR